MPSVNTRDLSKMGYRELEMTRDLLTAYLDRNYAKGNDDILTDGVTFEFNPNSGEVFLTDDDYHALLINDDGKLEAWASCGNCGAENFASQITLDEDGECEECQNKKTCPDCFGLNGQHSRASCTE